MIKSRSWPRKRKIYVTKDYPSIIKDDTRKDLNTHIVCVFELLKSMYYFVLTGDYNFIFILTPNFINIVIVNVTI